MHSWLIEAFALSLLSFSFVIFSACLLSFPSTLSECDLDHHHLLCPYLSVHVLALADAVRQANHLDDLFACHGLLQWLLNSWSSLVSPLPLPQNLRHRSTDVLALEIILSSNAVLR